ncbi:MAG: hypothetical protein HND47_18895 [Chloroflexi bacterium]|nr:hypothetical protein [Chloroflexota bacterium]
MVFRFGFGGKGGGVRGFDLIALADFLFHLADFGVQILLRGFEIVLGSFAFGVIFVEVLIFVELILRVLQVLLEVFDVAFEFFDAVFDGVHIEVVPFLLGFRADDLGLHVRVPETGAVAALITEEEVVGVLRLEDLRFSRPPHLPAGPKHRPR